MNRFSSLLFLFFFLSSCAGNTSSVVHNPADVRTIPGVPLFEDSNKQCGPSSLAAVMNYWHARSPSVPGPSPEKISSEIYSKGARGTLGMDLEFYAGKNGFQTRQYSGSVEDIRNNIISETPLIILVDYGVSVYQRNHFVVVTGFSSEGIIVHSGGDEKNIPFKELEKIWKKTNYWTLVIRPQD